VSKRAFSTAAAGAATVIACALVTPACSPSKPAAAATDSTPKPIGFKVSAAQRARLEIVAIAPSTFRPTIEVTGTVAFNGDQSTQVLAPISGPVVRLLVNPGADVTPGQALATVSSPDFAADVATYRKAEEAARNTQRILKLNEQLFQNDAIARSDLDQSRTDAASAAADLESAAQQLRSLGVEDATITAIHEGKQTGPLVSAIRAPIAGTVVEKLINPGQLLTAGTTPTFTIADLSTVWVMANVYETDLGLVSAGESADILTDAQTKPPSGRVDYVAALVDPGTKATAVRILVENTGRVLKRDMFVRVRIHSARVRTGLLVPVAAMLRDEENLPFLFIAASDGSFVRRKVTVGYRVDDRYEITSGLAAGDQVIANGAVFIQFAESQ
jgi:membrane fusion protein, heavy metal efflux system